MIKKCVIILVSNIFAVLFFTACSGNIDESNNPTTTHNATNELESYQVRGEIPQEIIDVLLNDAEFIDTEKRQSKDKDVRVYICR